MPRRSSDPSLFNEMLQLPIKQLKDAGYLDGGYYRKTLHWKVNSPLGYGDVAAEIEVVVDTEHEFPSIRFIYCTNGINQDYLVPLRQKPSNTGIGKCWYFVPEPGMYCLKLYLHENKFVGRKHIKGAFYRCQVLAGTRKRLDKFNTRLGKIDATLKNRQRKYFNQVYKDGFTKAQRKVQAAFVELQELGTVNLLICHHT